MVGIVIISHGDLAPGLLQAGSMVFGDQPSVGACSLTPDMGPDDIRAQIEGTIQGFEDPENVVILADLWGGTPFNQASAVLDGHQDTWAIVTGVNLPMLIEAYTLRMDASKSAHDIASQLVATGREGVRVKPESLDHTKAAQPTGAKPAAADLKNVAGGGRIKFVLCRIDTRLLHGQVATTWTKMTKPDRIIVVSDAVAHDELRKSMIEQAAPPGVRAHVIPINKLIAVSKDPRFGATRAMLLFETPQDLLRAVKGGVEIKEVNLGSIAHSTGKVVVTNAVAVDEADVACLEELADMGIKFDVRKVPADASISLANIMKKAKAELAGRVKE
ncbi:PTS sugar transporter subunit IIB [Collinsella sp. AGMB00827]|uniref:PTS system mannose-specific EIIAB component n=1 Tax=Collinsella ureilytica TaxID=2869515 RepID=A0ABS7MIW5_9ACTN|nr:PTS sugar transporter subunit IIB [Collinsella urealyticum]MBY4797031.1 PTS sugar transporter subunit IIB [Collinsella urealyticum]